MKTYEEHEMAVISFSTGSVFNDVVASQIELPDVGFGSKKEYSDS